MKEDGLTLPADFPGTKTLTKPLLSSLHFGEAGLTLHADGRIEYNNTPDEAAQAFIDSLQKIWPEYIDDMVKARMYQTLKPA